MKKYIPSVRKRTLLLIVGAVWCIAGFNIMRIGTPDMIANWKNPLIPLIFSLIVFGLFIKFVFYKMVTKHSVRIKGYETLKVNIFKFFDVKGYIIMAGMITFGVLLRKSGIVNPLYLGTFYTGLGSSLMIAGILFFFEYVKYIRLCKNEVEMIRY